jgi:DNA-binding transcriptional ArsR family regulator
MEYLQTGIYRISEPAQMKALSHPFRVRILRILMTKAATVEQLADELGEASGRIHYHVKMLERHGLIKLVDTKQKLGVVEKYYRAVASAFELEGVQAERSTALATFLGLWREAEQKVTQFLTFTDLRPEPRPTDIFLFRQLHLDSQNASRLIAELQQVITAYSEQRSDAKPNYHLVVVFHPLLQTSTDVIATPP